MLEQPSGGQPSRFVQPSRLVQPPRLEQTTEEGEVVIDEGKGVAVDIGPAGVVCMPNDIARANGHGQLGPNA